MNPTENPRHNSSFGKLQDSTYNAMLEAMDRAALLIGSDGTVLAANSLARETAASPGDLLRADVQKLLPCEHWDRLLSAEREHPQRCLTTLTFTGQPERRMAAEIRTIAQADPAGPALIVLLHTRETSRSWATSRMRLSERVETLRSLELAVLNAETPGEVIEAGLRSLHRILACRAITVVELDWPDRLAIVRHKIVRGELAAPDWSLSLDELSASSAVFASPREHLLITKEQLQTLHPQLLTPATGAVLRVPLAQSEKVIGEMYLCFDEPDAIDAYVQELSREVADAIAIAVQKYRGSKTLSENRQRYRQLVRTMSEGLFVLDADFRINLTNEALRELLGYESSEMDRRDIRDFMDEPSRELASARLVGIRAGKAARCELTWITKTGDTVPALVSAQPFRDEDGTNRGALAVVTDLTEITRARAENEKLAALVRQTQEAVLLVDDACRATFANPAAMRMIGLDVDDILSRRPQELFPSPDGRSDRTLPICEAVRARTSRQGRVTWLTAAGQKRIADLLIAPLRDSSGNISSYIVSCRDVTEHVLVERRLRESEKMRTIGQLAGGIAHDFNNLLTVILGNAELLRMEMAEPSESGSLVEQIATAAKQAAGLTSQLLAFARKGKYRTENVDLHVLVRSATEFSRHAATGKVHLEFQLDATRSLISGDPDQLQAAVISLLINAYEAMPGGGQLLVRSRNRKIAEDTAVGGLREPQLKPGTYVALDVEDTGHGIDPEIVESIFEPFFTTKQVGDGSGLGLSGVYGCMRSHGGDVSVTSEPGDGSTFTIWLPVAETPAE
ncbi:MAG: PAS domain S-box protein [Phycisphaerae bacterium]